ncbi:Crp/Fnr family transcriptional regulator [Cyanothece sp. BG0011]|uniref:Crp/Fnr family transcriptional regulator n=1 Tax=Cyanothece sp. BG0011 TaxID=2082950 RepID=UPI000D1F227F
MSPSRKCLDNKLLLALPESEYKRLSLHFKPIILTAGTVIHECQEKLNYAYFPNSAMISLLSIMETGNSTEVSLVGNEGMVGLPIILGGDYNVDRAIVSIGGTALRVEADPLKQAFEQGERFQNLLLFYIQTRLTQVAQIAACNRQHTIEQRLARWLLSVYDCVLENPLPLTHELMANLLGTRRAGVTVAANKLQRAGIIQYSRGKITILNREELENSACECYGLIQNELAGLHLR